jgi:CheY-like chemotaxis protein
MLGMLGLDVVEAEDGMRAVEIFERRGDEIDLVLLDVNMPRMGGGRRSRRYGRCGSTSVS